MPKPEIYYVPICVVLQKLLHCTIEGCKESPKHQYGPKNDSEGGYDIQLLCDKHMREIVITTNPEGNKDHWIYEIMRRK